MANPKPNSASNAHRSATPIVMAASIVDRWAEPKSCEWALSHPTSG
jgi:hypothetical protein